MLRNYFRLNALRSFLEVLRGSYEMEIGLGNPTCKVYAPFFEPSPSPKQQSEGTMLKEVLKRTIVQQVRVQHVGMGQEECNRQR